MAINQVYDILSSRGLTAYQEDAEGLTSFYEDSDLVECFHLLQNCRLKLDRLGSKRVLTMKQRQDEKARKLREQLATLERQYVVAAKTNPQSINDTQAHLANIDKLVRGMKRIRGKLGMYSKSDAFLKAILYPSNRAETTD